MSIMKGKNVCMCNVEVEAQILGHSFFFAYLVGNLMKRNIWALWLGIALKETGCFENGFGYIISV